MIILPDRTIPRGRFLLPQRRGDWRQPSQRSGLYQIENQRRFRADVVLDDGYIVWRGWFDDREDFDAFLWAWARGSLRFERDLWRLPTPHWHPDLGENIVYATVDFITSTSGSNQTYNVPADWVDTGSKVEVIAGGGGGGTAAVGWSSSGGGSGAYNIINDVDLTPSGTATYRLEAAAAAATAGKDVWFNDTVFPSSGSHKVGAKAGGAGSSGGAASGGAGGNAASNYPVSGNSGAAGGSNGSGWSGGGGAGAAGPTGVGRAGGNAGSGVDGSAGGGGGSDGGSSTAGSAGSAGAGTGGAGGANTAGAAGGAGGTVGNPGANATNPGSGGGGGGGQNGAGGMGGNGAAGNAWSTHGPGGGGGGGGSRTTKADGGAAGNFGAGGGGSSIEATPSVGGVGAQGIIVVTYTPAATGIVNSSRVLPL